MREVFRGVVAPARSIRVVYCAVAKQSACDTARIAHESGYVRRAPLPQKLTQALRFSTCIKVRHHDYTQFSQLVPQADSMGPKALTINFLMNSFHSIVDAQTLFCCCALRVVCPGSAVCLALFSLFNGTVSAFSC